MMTTIRNKSALKNTGATLAVMLMTGAAHAGLATAKAEATLIQTGLYALVGVVAVIYLIWMGVMAFAEKKSWSDFGWSVVYVSFVGGAVAIADWAWKLFV